MIESLGWVAGLLFAFCALPQAAKSIKEGHSRGVSMTFLLMWFIGEILSIFYIYLKHGIDQPLMANYLLNIMFILCILKYKLKERTC